MRPGASTFASRTTRSRRITVGKADSSAGHFATLRPRALRERRRGVGECAFATRPASRPSHRGQSPPSRDDRRLGARGPIHSSRARRRGFAKRASGLRRGKSAFVSPLQYTPWCTPEARAARAGGRRGGRVHRLARGTQLDDLVDRKRKAGVEAAMIAAGATGRLARKPLPQDLEGAGFAAQDVPAARLAARRGVAEFVVDRAQTALPHLAPEAQAMPRIAEALVAPGVDHLVQERLLQGFRMPTKMLGGQLDEQRLAAVRDAPGGVREALIIRNAAIRCGTVEMLVVEAREKQLEVSLGGQHE